MIKRIFDSINLIPFGVVALVLGLDIFVKQLVLLHMDKLPLFVVSFFGKVDLWIDLVYNKGAAWGSFAKFSQLLLVDYHPFFCLNPIFSLE